MSDQKPKKTFAEVLADVREAIRIISDRSHCVGFCENWKVEGPRSYTVKAPIVNGVCSKCHRPPYKKHIP